MTKYVVTYTLPYEHVVRIGLEADTVEGAEGPSPRRHFRRASFGITRPPCRY